MNDNDTITLSHLLAKLKRLDYNGWCCATDGSLDCYSIEEQIEIISDSINYINHNS